MTDDTPRLVGDQWRIIAERHGKRSRRWRWTLERRWSARSEWALERQGYAWTMTGAREKALRSIYSHSGSTRFELIYCAAHHYVPRKKVPSPLKPQLLEGP